MLGLLRLRVDMRHAATVACSFQRQRKRLIKWVRVWRAIESRCAAMFPAPRDRPSLREWSIYYTRHGGHLHLPSCIGMTNMHAQYHCPLVSIHYSYCLRTACDSRCLAIRAMDMHPCFKAASGLRRTGSMRELETKTKSPASLRGQHALLCDKASCSDWCYRIHHSINVLVKWTRTV